MKCYGICTSVGEKSAGIACDRPIKEARVASFRKLSGEIERETSTHHNHLSPAYNKWRRDDLYHLAQQKGIENRANMTNEELARALSRAQAGSP